MSKQKYSFIQLNAIKNDIEKFFELENKVSRNLAYALNKNKRIINSELELLKEDFKKGVPELENYRKEVHAKLEECGATKKMNSQGNTYLTDMDKVDVAQYEKEVEKIDKKYKEQLKQQDKINEENEALAKQKVAEVDFFTVRFEDLPEQISPKALTDNLTLLIKDE